jgi:site-specific DNA-methyltransferase (adenine-specific)
MLQKEEMSGWMQPVWSDIKGASVQGAHPAPYPAELAERLIRLFSFAGDTILDPFAGSGSTSVAALRAGRSSVSVEIEPKYLSLTAQRLRTEAGKLRLAGPRTAVVEADIP